MDLNKVPRWALLLIAGVGMVAISSMISVARADLDKFKGIAYQAKNVSDSNTTSISELKDSVKDIRVSQEQFRREYREDQKNLDTRLIELLKAVKK